jgi:hypothetical protein
MITVPLIICEAFVALVLAFTFMAFAGVFG